MIAEKKVETAQEKMMRNQNEDGRGDGREKKKGEEKMQIGTDGEELLWDCK